MRREILLEACQRERVYASRNLLIDDRARLPTNFAAELRNLAPRPMHLRFDLFFVRRYGWSADRERDLPCRFHVVSMRGDRASRQRRRNDKLRGSVCLILTAPAAR